MVYNVFKFSCVEYVVFILIEFCLYIVCNDDVVIFGWYCDSFNVVD